MPDTLITRRDGVTTVTFNRPEKKNALTSDNWAALDQVLREVAVNPADRALVLTGSGGAFRPVPTFRAVWGRLPMTLHRRPAL